MIDVEILTNLENFEDEAKARFSLEKIRENGKITFEEAEILVKLLVPFFKSGNPKIQKLAEEAYDFIKASHGNLEMPEEMLDTSLGARKLKREFEEFKMKRTAEIEALKTTNAPDNGKPMKPVDPPWEKTKIRTEKSCFWDATKAMDAADYEEAEKCFALTLQFNDERSEAWLGKGIAIGNKEDSPLYRIEEVVECFKNALKYGLKENKEQEAASKTLSLIAGKIFKQAILAWETFADKKKLKDRKIDFTGVTGKFQELNEKIVIPAEKSFEALVLAWKIRETLDVARSLVLTSNILSEIGFLEDEKKATYKKLHDQYQVEARKFDPTFEIGETRRCFVVTATMDGENNEFVEVLCLFRDRILNETLLGKQIIAIYYKIGPFLANCIRNSNLLKTLAFHLLVKPASKFARFLLWKNKNGLGKK